MPRGSAHMWVQSWVELCPGFVAFHYGRNWTFQLHFNSPAALGATRGCNAARTSSNLPLSLISSKQVQPIQWAEISRESLEYSDRSLKGPFTLLLTKQVIAYPSPLSEKDTSAKCQLLSGSRWRSSQKYLALFSFTSLLLREPVLWGMF